MTPQFDINRAYYLFLLIRRTEEAIIEIYPSDKIKSPVHLSIGQEAIAVGTCMALQADDVIFSNYRGHAHYMARGGDLNRFWAELYGKETGCCKGKGGSMHLADLSVNFMPASAIVASAIPNAVGYAMAMKATKKPGCVVVFLGDGATEEGVFWESLNFASLKKLPVLFVCENNNYAIYSEQSHRQSGQSISQKCERFDVPSAAFQGYSTSKVFAEVLAAREDIINGGGPRFLEFETYRFYDHVGIDDDHKLKLRPTTDMTRTAIEQDDLLVLAKKLPSIEANDIAAKVTQNIKNAIAFADASDFPTRNALLEQ